MADVNESVVVNNDNSQAQEGGLPQEVREMMEYSVYGKVPQQASQEQSQEVLSQEQQVVTNNEAAPQQEVVQQQEQVAVDVFAPFKEKYGYEKPEDIEKDIEEYRKIKEAPPAAIQYDNEVSERLHKAIQSGKTKEVYEILAQQERLDSLTTLEVDKENAADIIKYGMQLKYKDLTPQEIDFQFRKKFSYPKEPAQRVDELDEEFEMRKQEWSDQVRDIDTSKIIEAKLLKPELETAKANIKLPEVENSVDEDYIQWRKSLEEQPKIDEETKEAYKAFKPESFKTELDFNDEANKINFKFEFIPDAEGFESARAMLADNKFLETYINQDGTPNREQFLRDLYYGRNIQKVLVEAMKQAKNATLKAQLPDNVNGAGLNRMNAQSHEMSELDQWMKASLQVR